MERKIMEVLRRMQTVISEEQIGELKNVLNMVFAGCELQENTETTGSRSELGDGSGRLFNEQSTRGEVSGDDQ